MKYFVGIPYHAIFYVTVEADNRTEAERLARMEAMHKYRVNEDAICLVGEEDLPAEISIDSEEYTKGWEEHWQKIKSAIDFTILPEADGKRLLDSIYYAELERYEDRREQELLQQELATLPRRPVVKE
jgi:hypothetical protein